MKKITILLLVLILNSISGWSQSNITVFSEQGEGFWLVLNGIRQNEEPQTNVKVTGLIQPTYKLKIIFEEDFLGELDKNLFLQEYPAEVTYNIKKSRKDEYVLRYVSDVPIAQAPPAPQQQTVVNFTAQPRTTVSKTVTVTEGQRVPPGQVNVSVNTPIGGMNINVNDGMTHSSTTTTTMVVEENITTPDHYVLPGYNGPIGCPWPMSDVDFQSARNTIASKDWDETRLSIAKQVLNSNCLLSRQAADIIRLFDWEENRLDFAKYAYGRTHDLGNYYMVNDAFEWEASVTELNAFINSFR